MIRTKITWRGSPEITLAEFRRSLKPELQFVGQVWHHRFLPRHFTTAAARRYGYKPRGASYSRYKAKRFGHRNPLVFTGDLKAMVERMGRVSSTSRSVSVRMTGPRYLYMYRKDYRQPDKAAELIATSADEREFLARLLDRRITRRMNDITAAETVTDRSI